MAARKRLRLKLKYGTRDQTSDSAETSPYMKEDIMAMSSDHITHSPQTNAPQHPILSPLAIDSTIVPMPLQEPMAFAPALITTTRRRRTSKGSVIKRSASTPNVRRLATGEAEMSLAEKRRNKLGYHRTSIACGHCRRRKIRCLLAPDDPQARCSNCIRLKKECNFLPVEQQPTVDRRPRTGSRVEGRSGDTSLSSSSSPGGHVIEQVDHFNPYHLPLQTHDFVGSVPPMSASILSPPASAAPISSRTFDFPHHDDRPHWNSPFYDHGPVSAGHQTSEDGSHSYWKYSESPMTPAFSPYTNGPPNSLAQQPRDGGSFSPFGGPRQEPGWPTPQRSMSFGHVENLSHHYQNNYHQPYHLDFRRRASDMHPPSLLNSANSSNTSMSDPPAPPLSAPLSSQPMQHHLPPAWNNLTSHAPMTKPLEFGNWYSEPGQLAKVQEEESGFIPGGGPAVLYSTAGQH